jgi:hypothetical protein
VYHGQPLRLLAPYTRPCPRSHPLHSHAQVVKTIPEMAAAQRIKPLVYSTLAEQEELLIQVLQYRGSNEEGIADPDETDSPGEARTALTTTSAAAAASASASAARAGVGMAALSGADGMVYSEQQRQRRPAQSLANAAKRPRGRGK